MLDGCSAAKYGDENFVDSYNTQDIVYHRPSEYFAVISFAQALYSVDMQQIPRNVAFVLHRHTPTPMHCV